MNVGKLDPLESAIYSLGTARKNAGDAITVDFGMVDPGSLSAGEYKIVSIDEWSEGFAKSGLSDFDLRADIFDAYGVEYSFDWDGQNLTLTVVPRARRLRRGIRGARALCRRLPQREAQFQIGRSKKRCVPDGGRRIRRLGQARIIIAREVGQSSALFLGVAAPIGISGKFSRRLAAPHFRIAFPVRIRRTPALWRPSRNRTPTLPTAPR